MKKLLLFTLSICLIQGVFAQFGGGSGTETNPYIISSIIHIEELYDSVTTGNPMSGVHFSLNNSIEDSVRMPIGKNAGLDTRMFDGIFHGHNNSLITAIDLRESAIDYGYNSLFPLLGTNGVIDSLTITGYIFACNGIVGYNYGRISFVTNSLTVSFSQEEFSQYVVDMDGEVRGAGICKANFGIVINCVNNAKIHGTSLGGISEYNEGFIADCLNRGEIVLYNDSYSVRGGGISAENYNSTARISGCTNLADITFTGNHESHYVCGIVGNDSGGTIKLCQNYGNISGKITWLGGIVGYSQPSPNTVSNCSNYGNISGEMLVGGITGVADFGWTKNCFNSGRISGENYIGGIHGLTIDTTINCLNIGRTTQSSIIADTLNAVIESNYYDKQMCRSKGIADADVPNSAEGKLTTQLTGTSPELQAMLGDGWSYAEGRYPIPLGLENDSMALVAATPVYLHFETEEAYNHVDSVSKNFTVGLENNVSWDETFGRVSFSDENVTLLSLGTESMIVSSGDYSKKIQINIVDTEVSNHDQIIENGISVYPNPAGDNINLCLNGIKADKIEIYDITGKLLLSNFISTGQPRIATGGLNPGLYFMKIYISNKDIATLRFIKN